MTFLRIVIPLYLFVWAWSFRKTGVHPSGRSPRACFSGSCSKPIIPRHSTHRSARLLAAGLRRGFQTASGRFDFSVRAKAKSCGLWHLWDMPTGSEDVR